VKYEELMVALYAAIYRGARYFSTGNQTIEIRKFPNGMRYAEVQELSTGRYFGMVQQNPRLRSDAGRLARSGVGVCWITTSRNGGEPDWHDYTGEGVINGVYFRDARAEVAKLSHQAVA
jgi:hypothetical protein